MTDAPGKQPVKRPVKSTGKSAGVFLQPITKYGDVTDQDRSYWAVMIDDINKALMNVGLDCQRIKGFDETDVAKLNALHSSGNDPDFILTFNMLPDLSFQKQYYVDAVQSKVICLFMDNPIWHMQIFSAFTRWRDFYFGIMDAAHGAFLKTVGVDENKIFLFPQAGPEIQADPIPFTDRETDVMFMGGIGKPTTDKEFLAGFANTNDAIQRALLMAHDQVLEQSGEALAAFQSSLMAAGEDRAIHIEILARAASDIDRRARTIRRYRLFETLKNIPVTFYGAYDDAFKKSQPLATFKDGVTFKDIEAAMGNTKIVINDNINMQGAALMRFFYGISRGALMATELNDYLKTGFKAGEHVIELGINSADNANRIQNALASPGAAQTMIDRSSAVYKDHHLWGHRLPSLLPLLQ